MSSFPILSRGGGVIQESDLIVSQDWGPPYIPPLSYNPFSWHPKNGSRNSGIPHMIVWDGQESVRFVNASLLRVTLRHSPAGVYFPTGIPALSDEKSAEDLAHPKI